MSEEHRFEELTRLPKAPATGRHRLSDVRRYLLGFRRVSESKWEGIPQCHFKPTGLLLFNCPDDATLEIALISNNLQILASSDPVPARFFATALSFEQLKKRLDEGYEPPSWPDFNTCQIGQIISLGFSRASGEPFDSKKPLWPVMWGLGI